MSQSPSVGRIVHFVVDSGSAEAINRRRTHAYQHLAEHQDRADGSQVHVGNDVAEGDVLPAVIVRVWENDLVNLKVLLDGNDDYWATSVAHIEDGTAGFTWHWPERVA